jgi:hypothetical protein
MTTPPAKVHSYPSYYPKNDGNLPRTIGALCFMAALACYMAVLWIPYRIERMMTRACKPNAAREAPRK